MGRRAKPAKRKVGPKIRKPPKDGVKVSELERRLAEAQELKTKALEQQKATSDILRAIAGAHVDVQPVFDAIAQSAMRLCQARTGAVHRFDGTAAPLVALAGGSERERADFSGLLHARPIARTSPVGRALLDRVTIHIPDVDTYAEASEFTRSTVKALGWRSGLFVPMVRGGAAVGAIVVSRVQPGPFSPDQIKLLETFADQGVIAIENVRLFKELEAANRGLTAASQHKSEFLANMSHELRTPLNAIIGYSELLEEEAGDLDGGRLVPDLQKIAAAAKHQLSLINDILDLSKVEAGRMELELTAFDLDTAIDNALTLVRERASRRSIVLGRAIDDPLGTIRADERKVKQVLLNLLSNALKFTPEGGRIDVRAAVNEGVAEISVTDTGVGIAPEDQKVIFEEFRQVGTADKKVEGTGLGLSLARKFIELHGGRIWVKSQVGEGSTFTFTLPVRREE